MFQNEKKRAARRGQPITGYTGHNGGGKSAAMVWDTLPSLDAGRPVLSTVRLLDWRNPRDCDDAACEADPASGHYVRALPEPHVIDALFAVEPDPVERILALRELGEIVGVHKAAHPLYVPLVDWSQVLEARGCDLLLDEVTGAASSRESSSLPAAIANKLVQLRRNDVVVRWSAPAWMRADKIIRECSTSVVFCRGYLSKRVREDNGGERAWRQRRMFRWQSYDAAEFEDFTSGKRKEMRAEVNDWHWGPRSPAFQAYDTYDTVLSVGVVDETGTCWQCGGSRRRKPCPGHDNEGDGLRRPVARGPRLRGAAPDDADRLLAVVTGQDPGHGYPDHQ